MSTNVEPPKLAMMTVNIKIEQPDIILVESLETKECDALVLNVRTYLNADVFFVHVTLSNLFLLIE